jgi:type II secretory pathway pseudopilin PulG
VSNKKGFLLLEVMVSVVIITGGLLFVMRGYSIVRETLERSRALFGVFLLAEQKMFDCEIKGAVEEGESSGEFPDSKGFSWKLRARALAPEDSTLNDLEVVEINVFDQKKPLEIGASLFTYLPKAK